LSDRGAPGILLESDSFKLEFRAAVSCSKLKNYIISRICFWVKRHFSRMQEKKLAVVDGRYAYYTAAHWNNNDRVIYFIGLWTVHILHTHHLLGYTGTLEYITLIYNIYITLTRSTETQRGFHTAHNIVICYIPLVINIIIIFSCSAPFYKRLRRRPSAIRPRPA